MLEEPRDPAAGSLFDLVVFLVSGARGAPEEGAYTASLRLIDAAGRLARIAATADDDQFLAELGERVGAAAGTRYMESTESYVAFLDGVLGEVAREVRRRNGLDPAPDP